MKYTATVILDTYYYCELSKELGYGMANTSKLSPSTPANTLIINVENVGTVLVLFYGE